MSILHLTLERYKDSQITPHILQQSATLFSGAYGTWEPLAAEKMGHWAKKGIKMSADRLKKECIPHGADNVHVHAIIGSELAGHASAVSEGPRKGYYGFFPVNYVRKALLKGTLFDDTDAEAVACADTGFYVDHEEPLQALGDLRVRDVEWPLGDLPDGHEFLALVEAEEL